MRRTAKLVAALAAAAIAVLQIRWALSVPVGSLNDDALFLLLARAVRAGRLVLPDGFDQPVTDPLPGFAVILALPEKFLAGHWDALRLGMLVFSWIGLWAAFRLARRVLPGDWAAAATLLIAANHVFMIYCGVAMPDLPLAALAAWALAELPERPSTRALCLVAALAAAACLVRPEGLALGTALTLAVFASAGVGTALAFAAGVFTPLGLWLLRNRLSTDTATRYLATLRGASPAGQPGGQLGHLQRLAATLLGEGLLGLIGLSQRALLAAAAVVVAFAGVGVARRLRRGPDYALFALTVYATLILLLHAAWGLEYVRYLLPLLAPMWILIAVGARELLGRRPRAAAVLAALLLAVSVGNDLRFLDARAGRSKTLWPQTMEWVRTNTAPGALLQSAYYAPLMYFTGRPTIPSFGALPAEVQAEACRRFKVAYQVLDQQTARWTAGAVGAGSLVPAQRARPVYRNSGEGSLVYVLAP